MSFAVNKLNAIVIKNIKKFENSISNTTLMTCNAKIHKKCEKKIIVDIFLKKTAALIFIEDFLKIENNKTEHGNSIK